MSFICIYPSDNPARIANGYGIRRDILHHHTACSNDAAVGKTVGDGHGNQDTVLAAWQFNLRTVRYVQEAISVVLPIDGGPFAGSLDFQDHCFP